MYSHLVLQGKGSHREYELKIRRYLKVLEYISLLWIDLEEIGKTSETVEGEYLPGFEPEFSSIRFHIENDGHYQIGEKSWFIKTIEEDYIQVGMDEYRARRGHLNSREKGDIYNYFMRRTQQNIW